MMDISYVESNLAWNLVHFTSGLLLGKKKQKKNKNFRLRTNGLGNIPPDMLIV